MKRAFAAVVIVAALCLCLTACTGEQGEVREKYAALGYASYDLSPEELGLDGETVDFVYYGIKDANTDSPRRVYVVTFKGLDAAMEFETANAEVLPNLIRSGRAVVFGDAEAVEAY